MVAPSHDSFDYRLRVVEDATTTLAKAAERQSAFNLRVELFMEAAKTWGKVGLIVLGAGQTLLVGVLLYGIQKLGE